MLSMIFSIAICIAFIVLFLKISVFCVSVLGKLIWFAITLGLTIIGFFCMGAFIFVIAIPLIILGLLLS